jgi:uncharacterized membrane protein AbrB (regulator of aidB expression)
MAQKLSVGRVLKRDWPSLGLTVFLGMVWVLAIAGYFVAVISYPEDKEGWELAPFLGGGLLVVTAVCSSVIVWRIQMIRRVFACGQIVRGQVRSVGENSESIGHAVIAYQYQSCEYLVTNVTEGAGGRREFTPNDFVDVVIDTSHPSRAFIAELFLG